MRIGCMSLANLNNALVGINNFDSGATDLAHFNESDFRSQSGSQSGGGETAPAAVGYNNVTVFHGLMYL